MYNLGKEWMMVVPREGCEQLMAGSPRAAGL